MTAPKPLVEVFGFDKEPSPIYWVCEDNFAVELADELQMATNVFATDIPHRKRTCKGIGRIEKGLGRHDPDPEKNWPKCEVCGKTMIPLCSAGSDEHLYA